MSGDFDDMFQQSSAKKWVERTGEPRAEAAPSAAPASSAGDGLYKPYGFTPADDLETCDIVWWMPGLMVPQGQVIQYRFLVRLQYIGEDHLDLMLTDAIIHIEGRRLSDLRERMARRRITYVQAYNGLVWPNRPPEHEPMVERISILYPGEGSAESR